MAKKKSTNKAAPKKGAKKNSLVANINRRKKAGKSRSKKKSTVSKEAYSDMQQGWPDRGTNKRKSAVKKKTAKKKSR